MAVLQAGGGETVVESTGGWIVCRQWNSYYFLSVSPSIILSSSNMDRQAGPLFPLILCAAALCLPVSLPGQVRGTLRGRVTDAATGSPLANTNVYLSSTTQGTNTGPDGTYMLANVPPGIFDLVASRVGHKLKSVTIHVAAAETLRTDFALEPVTIQGEEVQVTARVNREWRRMLEKFRTAFLGRGNNASRCAILNPEVLDFRMESGTGILVASTDSVLRIENRALGYRLDARMGLFEWDVDEDHGRFVLYPKFDPLPPADSAEATEWQANRSRSYSGSMKHFFSSLVSGTLDSEGFFVSAGTLADLRAGKFNPLSPEDYSLRPVPGQPLWTLTFDNWLRVDYRGEEEHLKSYITLDVKPAILDGAGNLVDPLGVEVIGDWTAYRVADMLPLDERRR